jgi:hypothetical protein
MDGYNGFETRGKPPAPATELHQTITQQLEKCFAGASLLETSSRFNHPQILTGAGSEECSSSSLFHLQYFDVRTAALEDFLLSLATARHPNGQQAEWGQFPACFILNTEEIEHILRTVLKSLTISAESR